MREREREYSMGRGEDMSRVRIYRAEVEGQRGGMERNLTQERHGRMGLVEGLIIPMEIRIPS
jgi:hypothetical protein